MDYRAIFPTRYGAIFAGRLCESGGCEYTHVIIYLDSIKVYFLKNQRRNSILITPFHTLFE
ncbi:MAG: hypothetical protein DWB56_15920 [Candidatus Jettenia sp.]|uniref:Uncharacterized protein n=1 Tax=Candidatus Jettenia caeni TaxID=247490 RepID=I3IPM2_9BACT|nr:MAG: hypothetical protein EDM77_15335 [Candidatus Jettenia sp. AMX1]MBC6930412.1 hypothetical protein [Candidatus Jettenia sp.]MCE7882096.1 hypothetical protein [Candidatus Jettenia sp. AMX1]MCQ3928722.1 hypothetical protein [Candidatus Jettenia sp.]GAB63667.1 hypothetical protein KSU1_D0358 [Candidatus Jettenia caeni]